MLLYYIMAVGYLHIRDVDNIRYEVVKHNRVYYCRIRDILHKINVPVEYQNLPDPFSIVLSKAVSWFNFKQELLAKKFPEFLYINNNLVENYNIINIEKSLLNSLLKEFN